MMEKIAPHIRQQLPDYARLMRLDKPIGILLLLWPTLWALWVAAEGIPHISNLLIFTLGVICMRSAGCVINDYADRDFDLHVRRTKDRPLTSGRVSAKEALYLFAFLVGVSFVLVLFTNVETIYMSFGALFLASLYPFMKRYTYFPQAFLGAAFGWAVPMAFTAETNTVSEVTWLLYVATLLWTIAYDTQYAMVDRDDDLKIGIKSTAILFGEMDNIAIVSLQVQALCTMLLAANQLSAGICFYLGLIAAAGLFVYQYTLTQHRDRDMCFKAFLNNHWVGACIFVGILMDYALR
ncbi:4-hydroxybenzoate octaprenyltransferase [Litoribrevibacter albus]|uniref:4-hydroxybenzoate octaprenyltransferase n=1 Tax=Litoribrevibacter albus TaxID=1473156 RepID=A0AA37SBD8_9GAMM|nr:4-hydroxybenzoate octaprenyltransferase [Litoribrevibacter albus]